VVQQLREAFPYDSAPTYLICDRGFGRLRNMEMKLRRTGWGSVIFAATVCFAMKRRASRPLDTLDDWEHLLEGRDKDGKTKS
jgi:hypothetical protein